MAGRKPEFSDLNMITKSPCVDVNKILTTALNDPKWRPITANRYLPVSVLTSDDIANFFIDVNYDSMPYKGNISV